LRMLFLALVCMGWFCWVAVGRGFVTVIWCVWFWVLAVLRWEMSRIAVGRAFSALSCVLRYMEWKTASLPLFIECCLQVRNCSVFFHAASHSTWLCHFEHFVSFVNFSEVEVDDDEEDECFSYDWRSIHFLRNLYFPWQFFFLMINHSWTSLWER
jgi:hypothetical protein